MDYNDGRRSYPAELIAVLAHLVRIRSESTRAFGQPAEMPTRREGSMVAMRVAAIGRRAAIPSLRATPTGPRRLVRRSRWSGVTATKRRRPLRVGGMAGGLYSRASPNQKNRSRRVGRLTISACHIARPAGRRAPPHLAGGKAGS